MSQLKKENWRKCTWPPQKSLGVAKKWSLETSAFVWSDNKSLVLSLFNLKRSEKQASRVPLNIKLAL